MPRKEIDPGAMDPWAFYKVLTSSVVPRPIAWVSSLSADGVANLAPHSFFTVASVDPAVLQFTSVGRKDSQSNIEETCEFVVNFAPEQLFEQVNATATNFPAEVSEFEAVGVAMEPSAVVAPPRVAESPVAFECRYLRSVSFGESSTVVFGQVVHAAIDTGVLDGELPDVELLRPLARLGKIQWSELGPLRERTRIPYDEWPGHFDAREGAPGESG